MRSRRSGARRVRRTLDSVVVAGGGPAAIAAVDELRARGFVGAVTVLAGEPGGPYDRTACSKGLVDGRMKAADVALPLPAGAAWKPSEQAVGIYPESRIVTGSSGADYRYDGLIVATGARLAVPTAWPVDDPGIYPLRTRADAIAIRRALVDVDRVAIIGGGLTGCELACGIVQSARRVVVVDPNPTLLYRAVGEQFGALVTSEHLDAGVELRLGRTVVDVGRRRGRFQLSLDDGTSVRADLVVLATGETPNVEWLQGAGLDLSDGVLCDEALRAVGGDGSIVAAGAAARWPNLRYDTEPTRLSHWVSAFEQGAAAARTLLAGDESPPAADVIPRYCSLQRRLRIQVAGVPRLGTEVRLVRLRRSGLHGPARSGVLATYHRDGLTVAVAAINGPRAFFAAVRNDLAVLPQAAHRAEESRRADDLACASA